MVVWCTFNVDSGDMKNQNKDSDEGGWMYCSVIFPLVIVLHCKCIYYMLCLYLCGTFLWNRFLL